MVSRPPPVLDRLITRRIAGPQPPQAMPPESVTPARVSPERQYTNVTIWAKRQDWTLRHELLERSPADVAIIRTSTYLVRHDAVNPWTTDDQIIDDGKTYYVREIAEVGRRHLLEITVG